MSKGEGEGEMEMARGSGGGECGGEEWRGGRERESVRGEEEVTETDGVADAASG